MAWHTVWSVPHNDEGGRALFKGTVEACGGTVMQFHIDEAKADVHFATRMAVDDAASDLDYGPRVCVEVA